MILSDRKKLAKLMAIQDVTHRQLATAAGWESHSYVGRLLSGEVNTLKPDKALRIAKFLGVGVDDLFMTKVSNNSGHRDQTKVSA